MDNAASTRWSRQIPFRVDVAGIIHIMGTALYSRPQAALRELIQNSHDAIVRRQQTDLKYRGRIDVRLNAENHTIEIEDDGIGLNEADAERYLGTLGIGMTGLLKGEHPESQVQKTNSRLIGQFGIGLFSAFMLAEKVVVESRKSDTDEGISWQAGDGTDITLSSFDRTATGTTVRLHLRSEARGLCDDSTEVEKAIREYADYLPVPIFLNGNTARVNVIHSTWFDPTPDIEAVELEIASHFEESPLDVIPIHVSSPVPVSGALYVTPQRTPGFAGSPVVTVTVLGMVISHQIQDLLPEWASFIRGVLELPACRPTASREELVRNREFVQARQTIEQKLFEHFEELVTQDPCRFQSVLTWHRYMWAGSALASPRLRSLLKKSYPFTTSQGNLTFDEIYQRSAADPIFESEYEHVVWYNSDSRQVQWLNSLFAQHEAPCVHTLRSFEESLLAAMSDDVSAGKTVDLRYTTPGSPAFS